MKGWVAILAWACGSAHAAVTPLSGVTPQTTVAGSFFSETVVLRVTGEDGRPAAGAWLHWSLGDLSPLQLDGATACARAVTILHCRVQANADGVASLGRAFARWAGEYRVSVSASRTGEPFPQPDELGATELVLTALPTGPAAVIEAISGNGQRAAAGSSFAPLVVRARGADGRPLAGERVSFAPDPVRGPRVEMDTYTAITDAEGYARSSAIRLLSGVGRVAVKASYVDVASSSNVEIPFTLFATTPDGREVVSYQDMWWSGPAENGWGLAIAQREDRLFSVIFAYDDAGEPTWWVASGGGWTNGMGSSYYASLYRTSGAPYFAYDASRFQAVHSDLMMYDFSRGELQGSVSIGALPYGPQFGKSITRTDFSMPEPMALTGVGGLWWGGPSQNGWGVTIMEQPGQLFVVWLTYGADGKPTWFVLPSGRWEGTAWTGTLYRTRGSAWYGKAYDASRLSLTPVGFLRIAFDGTEQARFVWEVDGRRGSVPIAKQPF